MTSENNVKISPQAIAEFEMVIRETMEARLNYLERRLLTEIERRMRVERRCAELQQNVERLQAINSENVMEPEDAD